MEEEGGGAVAWIGIYTTEPRATGRGRNGEIQLAWKVQPGALE